MSDLHQDPDCQRWQVRLQPDLIAGQPPCSRVLDARTAPLTLKEEAAYATDLPARSRAGP
jgi:hypothetical protein